MTYDSARFVFLPHVVKSSPLGVCVSNVFKVHPCYLCIAVQSQLWFMVPAHGSKHDELIIPASGLFGCCAEKPFSWRQPTGWTCGKGSQQRGRRANSCFTSARRVRPIEQDGGNRSSDFQSGHDVSGNIDFCSKWAFRRGFLLPPSWSLVKVPFDPSQLLMCLCGENVVNLHRVLCCLDPGPVSCWFQSVCSFRSIYRKKSSWVMANSILPLFSVQTNIHMQITVDGKVDWLLVTWGAVAGGRFMLHKTALWETWGWGQDWDGSSSGTGNPAQSVWDPERSGGHLLRGSQ